MNDIYITPKQLYNKLNAKSQGIIGINKIYQLCKKKSFPAVKIGGKYMIIADKVDKWFEEQVTRYYKK